MTWIAYGAAFTVGLGLGWKIAWKVAFRMDDRERDDLFAEGFNYGIRHAHNNLPQYQLDDDENEWEWGVGA